MDGLDAVLLFYVVCIAIIVMIWIAIPIIPSNIAGKKGYSSIGFYFFGLVFFLPALIVSLCLQDKAKSVEKENLELIIKYNKMYKEGIISKEEYIEHKRELMREIKRMQDE